MFWILFKGWRRGVGWMLAMGLLTTGCMRPERAQPGPPKTVDDWFALKVGGRTVQVQLAIYDAEMEHGLMDRRNLGPDQGMLFVYPGPTQMSFWMRNTPLPLDIGFFAPDGELREIYAMYPYDETPIRSLSRRLQFALEMNQGWFHANGVKPGARLDLDLLRAALTARGAAPRDYGLP